MSDKALNVSTQADKTELRLRSHPKTSSKVLSLIDDDFAGKRILELGSGSGALAQALYERIEAAGLDPSDVLTCCDLHPDGFKFTGLECRRVDCSKPLPFDDASFDLVITIEVIEHLPDQVHFLRELSRILKPGGRAIITTPNILNANGRLRFFFTGTWPLFDAMPVEKYDERGTTGHIGPISLYYIYYFALHAGFRTCRFHIDRIKRSASLLAPWIWLGNRLVEWKMNRKRARGGFLEENRDALRALNSYDTLVGRTIIVEAEK